MTGDAGGAVSDGFRTGLGRIWEVLGGFGTPGFVAGPGRFVRGGAADFLKNCFILFHLFHFPRCARDRSGAGPSPAEPSASAAVVWLSLCGRLFCLSRGRPRRRPRRRCVGGETPGMGSGLRRNDGWGGPSVIPAQAGIQGWGMGSGLRRRNDEGGRPSYRRRPVSRGGGWVPACAGTTRGGRPSYRRRPVSRGGGWVPACAGTTRGAVRHTGAEPEPAGRTRGGGWERRGRRRNDEGRRRYDGRGVRRFHRTGPATWGCFPRSA